MLLLSDKSDNQFSKKFSTIFSLLMFPKFKISSSELFSDFEFISFNNFFFF